MLFDLYDLPFETQSVHLLFGALLGLVFGVLAQISRFCLRRGLVQGADRKMALGTWLTALLVAVVSVQFAGMLGWVNLTDHRFLSNEIPVVAILLGGLMFGAGMVLTRGCISRLTVLSGTGNMRAVLVLLVTAIFAHATMKGAFAAIRTELSTLQIDLGIGTLVELSTLVPVILATFIVFLIARNLPSVGHAVMASGIGLLVASGWIGTSWLLMDEFAPLPVQSLAFTAPWSETLFWTVASTSIPAGFGVGLVAGVLSGAFLSAWSRGELQLQSFETPAQTVRYLSGGAMMGFGGVLAGGCTVGAGLSGVSTLSIAAIFALLSIVAGAKLMDAMLREQGALIPAE